jgi:hypothetical protein
MRQERELTIRRESLRIVNRAPDGASYFVPDSGDAAWVIGFDVYRVTDFDSRAVAAGVVISLVSNAIRIYHRH